MNFSALISPECILAEMQSTDHWPAIVELVEHLHQAGRLESCNRRQILEDLRRREEWISTGIGSGVAIPHTFVEGIDGVVAALGRSRAGLDFQAQDSDPVHLVVLFLVPRGRYETHLQTLAAIARLIHNEEVRRRLLEAEDADEMFLALKRRSVSRDDMVPVPTAA